MKNLSLSRQLLIIIAAVSLWCASAFAEGMNGGFWAGYGMMSGDITYQIGGHSTNPTADYWFPLSELKWPMNVSVLAVGQEVTMSKHWEGYGELTKNFSSPAGKMEDSDWTNSLNTKQKTIFSTSDADLNSFTADIDFRYWEPLDPLNDTVLAYGIGGGFMFEQLDWKVSNVDQYNPSVPNSTHYIQKGIVGTFSNTANIPYLEFLAKIEQTNTVSLLLRFGYSPVASINSIDDHLLRQIYSTTSLNGNAYKGSLLIKYFLSPKWYLMFKGDVLTYDITGVQSSFVYGNINNDQGDSWTIQQRTVSTQYLLSVYAGMRF